MATGRTAYEAIVVLGRVDDRGSLMPGYDYPFSKAEEGTVARLQGRGYRRIGVFREPSLAQLRRLMAGSGLRAVAFIGHGAFSGRTYSFDLNDKERLDAVDLRAWAFEDRVRPQLSRTIREHLDADPAAADAMQRVAGYNFDLSLLHACHSLRDPALRAVLGGEVQGNPWYSLARLPPLASRLQHTLSVDPDAYARDPVGALQAALVGALAALDRADAALVQPGWRSALRDALDRLVEVRRQGVNVRVRAIDALLRQFSVRFVPGLDGADPLDPDAVAALTARDRRAFPDEVSECGMPTVSSDGELGCRHRVRGGGPCWQHADGLEPPTDDGPDPDEVETD